MGSAKVAVAVAAMLIGATGAGILTGGTLVVGGLLAWKTFSAPDTLAEETPEVAMADVVDEPVTVPAAPSVAVHAPPVVATTTPPRTAPTHAPATTSTTRPTATTTTRPATTTRSGTAAAPAPAAQPSGDLLAGEDEWESMGFDAPPEVAPTTPAPEPAPADEW